MHFARQANFKPWKNKARFVISLLLIALAGVLPSFVATPAFAATTYIYAMFKGDAAAQEKLWIYTSSDGVNFSQLSATGFGGNSGVLRDPSIMKHTDGKYYVAFTTQSWTTTSTNFGIASSTDLIHWTQIATINAGVANVKDTWAPEWFKDGSTVKLIVNIDQTTCTACFKPYIYTAQNSALTSWSAPIDMGIGTNHIDAFVVKSGSTYHAFVKDETSKFIQHTTASSLTGPWSAKVNLWTSGYEGPAVVQLENGQWRIYIDKYTNGGIWTATSSDLNNWSGLSLTGCSGCRHGTVINDPNYTGPTVTYYTITNRNSGKLMDVQNPNMNNGARVGQFAANGGLWQKWQFVDAGGGYFNIISQNSGKCLDVVSVSTADGASIDQWTCNGGQNQQFQWAATGSYFNIKARHSGKCVNVVGSSTADGALLEQRACGSGNSFQWTRQ